MWGKKKSGFQLCWNVPGLSNSLKCTMVRNCCWLRQMSAAERLRRCQLNCSHTQQLTHTHELKWNKSLFLYSNPTKLKVNSNQAWAWLQLLIEQARTEAQLTSVQVSLPCYYLQSLKPVLSSNCLFHFTHFMLGLVLWVFIYMPGLNPCLGEQVCFSKGAGQLALMW